jgi:hypothetical protein
MLGAVVAHVTPFAVMVSDSSVTSNPPRISITANVAPIVSAPKMEITCWSKVMLELSITTCGTPLCSQWCSLYW